MYTNASLLVCSHNQFLHHLCIYNLSFNIFQQFVRSFSTGRLLNSSLVAQSVLAKSVFHTTAFTRSSNTHTTFRSGGGQRDCRHQIHHKHSQTARWNHWATDEPFGCAGSLLLSHTTSGANIFPTSTYIYTTSIYTYIYLHLYLHLQYCPQAQESSRANFIRCSTGGTGLFWCPLGLGSAERMPGIFSFSSEVFIGGVLCTAYTVTWMHNLNENGHDLFVALNGEAKLILQIPTQQSCCLRKWTRLTTRKYAGNIMDWDHLQYVIIQTSINFLFLPRLAMLPINLKWFGFAPR